MIQFLENGGSFYIESVDIGVNHDNTMFLDYIGLAYMHDGSDEEIVKLNSGSSTPLANLSYYYMGGHDAHYSDDRLESQSASQLVLSSEDGYGRMFVMDNQAYKSIATSVMLGAIANGDTLNLRPYLVSEMINFFLDYNPVTSLHENLDKLFSATNYPNPFTKSTNIEYNIKESGFVTIDVYNISGQVLKRIEAGQKSPGNYTIKWDATNDQGELVSPGYYFYKIRSGNYTQTEKMILLR